MIVARAILCLVALLALAAPAQAVITCNLSVTPVSITYDPNAAGPNITSGTWSINCTRQVGDPVSLAWILEVNDGANGKNIVQSLLGNQYAYETYRIAPTTLWGTNKDGFTGTVVFGGSSTGSSTGPFDILMTAGQKPQPAGTYTDTLTATLLENAAKGKPPTLATATFGVTVNTTANCQILAPPGNVNFTYTAFQGSAATANTAFQVRCTTSLPYTMALDATSGTLLGLSYSLAIAPSTSGTGTGLGQNYTINGTIAPGQAGTCATSVCTGSQTRTLTLSW